MSFWFLIQLLLNIVLFAGLIGAWIRLNRPAKDDPRLSKGLQLLQSKIAVLEDLSDRTETQVNQLTLLLEQKCKEIQAKIQQSEKQLAKIDQSMQKSLEVAKIFQDRIPHNEILERQNTIKYVKAARLAHQGLSFDEIAQQVDLSRGEIEFIAKVNKEQLMFCEDSLPEWAQDEAQDEFESVRGPTHEPLGFEIPNTHSMLNKRDMSSAFEMPANDQSALKKLGEAFKAACEPAIAENESSLGEEPPAPISLADVRQKIKTAPTLSQAKPSPTAPVASSSSLSTANSSTSSNTSSASSSAKLNAKKNDKTPNIRPVEFRRIDLVKDLD